MKNQKMQKTFIRVMAVVMVGALLLPFPFHPGGTERTVGTAFKQFGQRLFRRREFPVFHFQTHPCHRLICQREAETAPVQCQR